VDKFVLDTSALLTYIEDEDGADQLEAYLGLALSNQIELFVSTVSLIEIFYITIQEQGQLIASERLQLLKVLPFTIADVEQSSIEAIGELKAIHRVSFADACIAGLAVTQKAILVHKDPEFEQLKTLNQIALPYKNSGRKQGK
jgi:predicted nucleic acid-binding protein